MKNHPHRPRTRANGRSLVGRGFSRDVTTPHSHNRAAGRVFSGISALFLPALSLLLLLAFPAAALEDGQVIYAGGSIPTLKDGALGHLDTTHPAFLFFQSSGTTLAIPYEKLESFEYTQPVARHLGVLPAIAVGLVKARQHRHFFRITYRDEQNVAQAALFEVPKQMARTLLAVLLTRAPQACTRQQRTMWNYLVSLP